MQSRFKLFATAFALAVLTGCASVPKGDPSEDARLKTFPAPPADQAGLYIYRDSFAGKALKKSVKIDNEVIGETANQVYFYRLITPGQHVLATESEFSDNTLDLLAVAGQNHYVRQSIKMGVFVGGAKLEVVPESVAQGHLKNCTLAK
ncbi:DUF2846 domain-containing protein [Pseudomonas sp. Marseille-Q8238]